jgi:hypothetical protein
VVKYTRPESSFFAPTYSLPSLVPYYVTGDAPCTSEATLLASLILPNRSPALIRRSLRLLLGGGGGEIAAVSLRVKGRFPHPTYLRDRLPLL